MVTQTSTSSTTLSDERRERIDSLVADTHAILERDGLTRDALAHIASALETLAARPELFSRDDFPPPDAASGDTSTRYRLNPGSDGIALYLNSLLPGKTTIAHNHDTWAVIVAVEGSEVNRVYKRTDDRRDDERATIEVDREVIVEPGTPIAFLPDDIHSIHVTGAQPTLHFHLYGRPLETLSGRLGFEDGRIVRYNQTHLHRQTQAVG
ncbi:cysteine dioxygenase [Caballeronia sp. INDeC2]|uniref:cysteine dioxygenase family protein n=1 Tax=Caballeronia sp. INDeC2 TaxID=2921747 RepID=UPI0020281920